MKKLIVGIAVIALLGIVAMPFVSGMIAEKTANTIASNANQHYEKTQTGMKIEVVNYKRNFRDSTIEWRLDLGDYSAFYGTDAIVFVEHLKHGYTGVTSETSLEKNSWYTALLKKYNVEKDPLHITTQYTLSGDITSQIQLDPLAIKIDKETLNTKPATLTVGCDAAFKHFTAQGQWDGFSVADKVSGGKMTITSDTTLHSAFLMSGTTTFNFTGLTAHNKKETAEIQGVQGSSQVDYNEAQNTITLQGKTHIEKVVVPGKTIEDMGASLTLSALDATAYEEAIQGYMNFLSNYMEKINGDDPEAIEEYLNKNMMSLTAQMMNMYEKICKTGLKLEINDVKATLPEGKIQGNAEITLLQDLSMGAFMLIAATPSEALNYIDLKTEIQFPKALSDNTTQLTSPVYPGMKTGLFVEDGKDLKHSAETRDKKLFINGHELQL